MLHGFVNGAQKLPWAVLGSAPCRALTINQDRCCLYTLPAGVQLRPVGKGPVGPLEVSEGRCSGIPQHVYALMIPWDPGMYIGEWPTIIRLTSSSMVHAAFQPTRLGPLQTQSAAPFGMERRCFTNLLQGGNMGWPMRMKVTTKMDGLPLFHANLNTSSSG